MYKDSIKQTILKILTKEILIQSGHIHSFVFFDKDLSMNEHDLNVLLFYIEEYYEINIPSSISLHSRVSELVAVVDALWIHTPEETERTYMRISA